MKIYILKRYFDFCPGTVSNVLFVTWINLILVLQNDLKSLMKNIEDNMQIYFKKEKFALNQICTSNILF